MQAWVVLAVGLFVCQQLLVSWAVCVCREQQGVPRHFRVAMTRCYGVAGGPVAIDDARVSLLLRAARALLWVVLTLLGAGADTGVLPPGAWLAEGMTDGGALRVSMGCVCQLPFLAVQKRGGAVCRQGTHDERLLQLCVGMRA